MTAKEDPPRAHPRRLMPDEPVGPLLDALNVTVDLNPGQHITEAVVIAKVTDFDTTDPTAILVLAKSEGLDWIAQLGLFHAAIQVAEAMPPYEVD